MIQTNLPKTSAGNGPTNEQIANCFDQTAALLEAQGANPFRVGAYRKAADTIRSLKGSVVRILKIEGLAGLIRLPGIGHSLAHSIDQMARTGRLPLLERLQGEDTAERAFATVADIGPKLACRIHDQLGIETLAELQAAAGDGRLAEVAGMGRKRITAVRESLAGRFRRTAPPPASPAQVVAPDAPISELLDADSEYRRLAGQGKLPRIAPRRFNPTREAWLPVLHTQRQGRHYTVLYSNTARAHELGTTHDWVVIYRDDDSNHGQWTVITANYGKLRGRRIVRGARRSAWSITETKTPTPCGGIGSRSDERKNPPQRFARADRFFRRFPRRVPLGAKAR